MTKKNDKRLCWNCEGNVSYHLSQCPYCGVDLSQSASKEGFSNFKTFASPFQKSTQQDIPQPPYMTQAQKSELSVTDEEWNKALHPEKAQEDDDEDSTLTIKREMTALLLLLPGVVFFLFGMALTLFSNNGVLSLQWNQSLAYFYFFGAAPLLYLGWRAFKK